MGAIPCRGSENFVVMTRRPRRSAALAILLAITTSDRAAATASCDGTYAAETLRPLPKQVIVNLDIRDPSPDHLRLARRFLAGMNAAGIASGARPTVLMSILSTRLDTSTNQPSTGAEPNAPGFSGVQGSFRQGLPAIPDTRLGATNSPPPLPTVLFRVEATEPRAAHPSWVANVQCQMTGTDDGALAQDLGRVMGGALGRRIERGPF